MTTTVPENGGGNDVEAAVMGIPFGVASRPQRRFSNVQTVDNFSSGGSFQVVQLPATGWVRRVHLYFDCNAANAVDGSNIDRPFNLVRSVTLTDATGQPVYQPISGYSLYVINKFMGVPQNRNHPFTAVNPTNDPEFRNAATRKTFRLTLDFEIDARTGYGSIPNLDSNASLQLKVDYDVFTAAFGAGTAAASTIQMTVEQEYWAPVSNSSNGVAVDASPPGAGDYREIRYETQTVSAQAENTVNLTNRGGLIQSVLLVSRNSGVRTAYEASKNVGVLLDNQPINEGIPLESHQDQVRRAYGYHDADVSTPAKSTVGGLDTGVLVVPFHALSGGRDSWLVTRNGSLFQTKITPGASATTLEVITGLMQVKDMAAFYNVGV